MIATPAPATKGQPSAVFVAFDADANGVLTAQELSALAQSLAAALAGPQPVRSVVAAQFDTNRSGRLEVIEVDRARQRLLSSQALPAPAASIGPKERIIIGLLEPQVDRNRDGLIDPKEFEVWEARTVIGSSALVAPAAR